MTLEVVTLVLGPLSNNTYIVADSVTKDAAVIDPSIDSQVVLDVVSDCGWNLRQIWLTHAHFDHLAGVHLLANSQDPALPVGLHPADLELYHDRGHAGNFGYWIESGPEPALFFTHQQTLRLGDLKIEVRHTPGHTPGHVVFHAPSAAIVFCGDLIFFNSVGRTDLPGGSHRQLLDSIQNQILTLPPHTRLLSGHGPETTVEEETANNPFL